MKSRKSASLSRSFSRRMEGVSASEFLTLEPRQLMSGNVAIVDGSLLEQPGVKEALSGYQTVVFDRTESAEQVLGRVVEAAGEAELDSVTIFSHGSAGAFELGGDVINGSAVGASKGAWAKLGSKLKAGGAIEIYGCETGMGSAGKSLVNKLAKLTKAEVFASNDVTGRGGDWNLEVKSKGAKGEAGEVNVAALNDAGVTLLLPVVTSAASATPSPVTGTTTALSVRGQNLLLGNDSNLTYSWTTVTAPAGGTATFSASGTNAAKDSVATFTKAGTYLLTASITDGLTTAFSSVSVTVGQTTNSIVVNPPATVPLNGIVQLSATAFDQFGDPLVIQPAFNWSTSSGNVTNTGLLTAGLNAGLLNLTVSVGNILGLGSTTVLNQAPNVTQAASAVTGLLSAALSVGASDDAGENALTYTWQTLSGPAGADLPSFTESATNAAKNTIATFKQAGIYNLLVTISDGLLSITSPVTVNIPQVASSISVTPGSVEVGANSTRQFIAEVKDQFGKTMVNPPSVTWTVDGGGTIDTNGLFTAGPSDTISTVTATVSTILGKALARVKAIVSPIDLSNPAPVLTTPPAANPSVVAGTTSFLTALASDNTGELTLRYTWSLLAGPAGANPTFSAANGTNAGKGTAVTFDRAGVYTMLLTVKDVGGAEVTATATLTVNQTVSSINVSGNTTLGTGEVVDYDAVVVDQFGRPMVVQPAVTWSVVSGTGTINASTGVYTANNDSSPSTAQIRAAVGAVTATIPIAINGNGTGIDLTPHQPTLGQPASGPSGQIIGTSAPLSVRGTHPVDESRLVYTWFVLSSSDGAPAPSFDVNGNNAAKDTTIRFYAAGEYDIAVTIADGPLSVVSHVKLTVVQSYTTIAIKPRNAVLLPNASMIVASVQLDQFGKSMANQQPYTVSATDGVVSQNQYFAAPATEGVVTLTIATADGKIGTTNVTISNDAPFGITSASAAMTSPTTATLTSFLKVTSGTSYTADWTFVGGPAVATVVDDPASGSATVTFTKVGTYTFSLAATDGDVTVVTVVQLTVDAVADNITVTAASTSLKAGESTQLSAIANDQFGAPITDGIVWSVDQGDFGIVSSSGVYTAPFEGGGVSNIRATIGGKSAAVSIITVDKKGKPTKDRALTPTRIDGNRVQLQLGVKARQKFRSGDNYSVMEKVNGKWVEVAKSTSLNGTVTIEGVQKGQKKSYKVFVSKGNVLLKGSVGAKIKA